MWYKDLVNELNKNYNEESSEKMSDYMQKKFKFYGIPKDKLKSIIKQFFKGLDKSKIDWDCVDYLWNDDGRESQYVAIEYLNKNVKNLTVDDISKLKNLIVTKSWWETVDSLDSMVGSIVLKNNKLFDLMLEWSINSNMWLRRVSIDFQQRYENQTNTEVLSKVIKNNLGSNEFFINKAIGWSLREYSKVNPEWVRNFIIDNSNELSKLSIKEASKYL